MPDTLLSSGYEESGKAYDEVFRPKNGVVLSARCAGVFIQKNIALTRQIKKLRGVLPRSFFICLFKDLTFTR